MNATCSPYTALAARPRRSIRFELVVVSLITLISVLASRWVFAANDSGTAAPSALGAQAGTKAPPVTRRVPPLSGPFKEIPRQDRLLSFAALPDLADGTLLYTEYVPKGTTPGNYRMGFVLRTSKEDNQRPDACETYYVEGIRQLFDPILLKGGERVLVKYGDYPGGSNLSPYRFYILDLVKHTWSPGPPLNFIYPRVDVSLDGRFVAVIQGGDIHGAVVKYSKTISMIVFDTVTGDYRVVLDGLYDVPAVAWTNRGSLLFEAEQPPYRDTKGREVGLDPAIQGKAQVPGIFEEPAMGGPRKLLLRNASFPVPSPDGRWILFWGWPDSTASPDRRVDPAEQGTGWLSAYLYDVAMKRRYVLNKDLVRETDEILWTPDSKRLLLMRYDDPRSDKSQDWHVLAMDVGTGKAGLPQATTIVGTLHARSGGAFHGSFGGQFRALRFTKDGKYLIVSKTEEKGLDKDYYYDYEDSLDALDLKTGEVREVAAFYDELGMDWTDVPLPDAAWMPANAEP